MCTQHRPSLSCSVEMWRGYLFLFVVISALQLASADDSPVVLNVQGIVGGNVHMRCVLERPHLVDRLYFQKNVYNLDQPIFVNGFYDKELKVLTNYINRTIVNKTELSMEMLDLSLADEGEYICIPFINSVLSNSTVFHLTVTASYRVPIITVRGCDNGPAAHNCVITCSSSGGFPSSNVTWSVVGKEKSSLLRDEGDLEIMQDTQSRLWNVSQSVTLNCSRLLNISCFVGGIESLPVSVCPPSAPIDIRMPIASAVLLLLSIAVIVIVAIKCRTQPSAERSTDAELANLK